MNKRLDLIVGVSSLLVAGVILYFIIKGLPVLAIMLSVLWALELFVLYKVSTVRNSKQGSKKDGE